MGDEAHPPSRGSESGRRGPDIEIDTFSFLDEVAAKARRLQRAITRRQGWLFFPLLALEGLHLHILAFRHLFRRDAVQGRWMELGLLVLRFGVFVMPLFVSLPVGMAFAFVGVHLAVLGVCMGVLRPEPQGEAGHRP